MTQSELDPVAIRKALIRHREAGLQFDQAWQQAIGDYSVPDYEREVYKFMRAHFRAAYYPDDDSTRGRCFIPELDVSNAILMAQHSEAPDHKRCRSGDGCDRLAVRGQFGKTWCEYHGAELDRIAAKIQVQIDNPKARSGGRSIVGTRGVRAA